MCVRINKYIYTYTYMCIYIYYLHLYGDLKHQGDISNEWEYLSNKQAVEL